MSFGNPFEYYESEQESESESDSEPFGNPLEYKHKPDTLYSKSQQESEYTTLDTWKKLPLFNIYLKADYDTLDSLCKVDKRAIEICNSRTFWLEKIKHDYPNITGIDLYKSARPLKDIYANQHIYNWLKERLTYTISNNVNEIEYLSLNNKNLDFIPKSIFKLKNLTELNLSYNNFTKFPENLTELKKLKKLNLSHNQLSEIPSSIEKLKSLGTLDLSYNNFSEYPESLLNVYLTYLHLNNNQITKITNVNRSLTYLDLSYNQLSHFSGKLPVLYVLRLNNNQLSDLPELNANFLQTLFIYNNKFTNEFISQLKKEYPQTEIVDTQPKPSLFKFGADTESESEVEANMDSGSLLINLAKHSELLGLLNKKKVIEFADSFDYPTAKMICELSGKINEMCGSTSILKGIVESQVGKSTVKNLCKVAGISHKFCEDNEYWTQRALIRFGEGYTQFAKENIKSSKDYNKIFENGIKIELKGKGTFAKFAIGDATKLAVSTEKELYFWDVPSNSIVNANLSEITQVVWGTSEVLGVVTKDKAYLYKNKEIIRRFEINKIAKWNSQLNQLAVLGTCKENECNIIVQNLEKSDKNIDIITTGQPKDLIWSDDSSKIGWVVVTSNASTNEVSGEVSVETVYVYSFNDKSIKSYTTKDKISFVSITADLTAIGETNKIEIHGSTLAPIIIGGYPQEVFTGEITKVENKYKLLVGCGNDIYVHSLDSTEIGISTATKIKTGNLVKSLDVSDNGKLVVTTSDDNFARVFFANA